MVVRLCLSIPENIYEEFKKSAYSQSKVFQIGFEFLKKGGFVFVENIQSQLNKLTQENYELKKQNEKLTQENYELKKQIEEERNIKTILSETLKLKEQQLKEQQLKFLKFLIQEKHTDLYELFTKNSVVEINEKDFSKLINYYKKLFGFKILDVYSLEEAFNIKITLVG